MFQRQQTGQVGIKGFLFIKYIEPAVLLTNCFCTVPESE